MPREFLTLVVGIGDIAVRIGDRDARVQPLRNQVLIGSVDDLVIVDVIVLHFGIGQKIALFGTVGIVLDVDLAQSCGLIFLEVLPANSHLHQTVLGIDQGREEAGVFSDLLESKFERFPLALCRALESRIRL